MVALCFRKKLLRMILATMFISILLFSFTSCPEEKQKGYDSSNYQGNNSISKKTKYIKVKGGTFQMGSLNGKDEDTKPVHAVTISPFIMSATEVTQELYESIMGYNPSYFVGENLPVENVSWHDAIEFCNELSKIDGYTPCYYHEDEERSSWEWDKSADGYRLPTEAEWEFAARGGNKSKGYKYSGSNKIDKVAWYHGNSENRTHKVKSKSPNELGLYDMSGNVEEWCWDYYGDYNSEPQTDPSGPEWLHITPNGTIEGEILFFHVSRGGCCNFNHGISCEVYERNAGYTSNYLGFRVVRSVTK